MFLRSLVQALLQCLGAICLCFLAINILITPVLHAFLFLLLTHPKQYAFCKLIGGCFFPGYLIAGVYLALGLGLTLLGLGYFKILSGAAVGELLGIFF